jgi:outer membrane lipoprotein carrier protein
MRCLLFFLTFIFSVTADATAIDRFKAFAKGTQSARGEFEQKVHDRSGRVTQESRGSFVFQRPGLFRWVYAKPVDQVIVGDGERVWIYDPDLNQVVKRRIDQALGTTPAALLAGRDDVERAFDWHDLPAADGLDWLGATPKDKESSFTEIRLGFSGPALAALEIFDNFGQRTLIRFSKFERNPKLAPDLFKFTPPKGADVVGD